jgi:hypothetical protein
MVVANSRSKQLYGNNKIFTTTRRNNVKNVAIERKVSIKQVD